MNKLILSVKEVKENGELKELIPEECREVKGLTILADKDSIRGITMVLHDNFFKAAERIASDKNLLETAKMAVAMAEMHARTEGKGSGDSEDKLLADIIKGIADHLPTGGDAQ